MARTHGHLGVASCWCFLTKAVTCWLLTVAQARAGHLQEALACYLQDACPKDCCWPLFLRKKWGVTAHSPGAPIFLPERLPEEWLPLLTGKLGFNRGKDPLSQRRTLRGRNRRALLAGSE